ncbi:response regulator [Bacteroidetes/Chlorobi group bacterium ChocPot_Mid]|nr:MAG: response regulator [Bacteroidetes/Chlorobi group bacterium ChocPot_Mid]
MAKVLIVDDEKEFRESLSERLKVRGYENLTLPDGEDALKVTRMDRDIDVVILDRKMPGLQGEQVLKEIKSYRPEIQVIMLTGHGTTESAMAVGRLDAFSYVQKPCELEKLIGIIEEARKATVKAKVQQEIPIIEKGSFWKWCIGNHNYRPGYIILGIIIFVAILLMPTPQKLVDILAYKKTVKVIDSLTPEARLKELNLGYKDYSRLKKDNNIVDYYSNKFKLGAQKDERGKPLRDKDGKEIYKLTIDDVAFRAKVMLGILVIAAFFWATGAIPIGITALIVGMLMYFFNVMNPDDVASAYGKDSVVFIFGILAVAVAIHKTGLDRRIGVLLMKPAKNLILYLLLFLPMLGIACSFLSEHAMVAFMMPILMMVYASSTQAAGVKEDPKLAILLVLSLNFAANLGGPGSPAAGGRNSVMMGILADYGGSPSFGEWVMYGLPFVPVAAICVGIYFYVVCYRKMKVKKLNISNIVNQANQKIGPMTKTEYTMAAIMILLITLWVISGEDGKWGMGGPVILAIVLMNVFGILTWRDVSKIQWEVVALYAGATAMGSGLASTGIALYLADSVVSALPDFMRTGEGLAIASSFITGIMTNFMSDGATVATLGPITVPMATISGTNPWMVGLATAFASSFAHMFLPGTPNNAIVFALAKNPITGEKVFTLTDLAKHGFFVLLISFAVLWIWIIFGYWQWIGF